MVDGSGERTRPSATNHQPSTINHSDARSDAKPALPDRAGAAKTPRRALHARRARPAGDGAPLRLALDRRLLAVSPLSDPLLALLQPLRVLGAGAAALYRPRQLHGPP